MMQSERIPPVPPSQVGFITVAVNCWSRNSKKVSRLKDRVWLPGSSALSAISLPLIVSGSRVGRAGPVSGRRHQLDPMKARTNTNPNTNKNARTTKTPVSPGVSARRYLRGSMYNVHFCVQCTLGNPYRSVLNGVFFK